jgi:glycosyltransferase involved in cell wall biosynthesis
VSATGLRLIVVARLDDAKLASKLQPLRSLPEVGAIDLVRRTPLPLDGVTSHCPPRAVSGVSPLAEPWRLATVLRLARGADRERTVLIAFFLMPHGLYAELARRLSGLRTIQVTLSQMDVDLALSKPWVLEMLQAAHRVGVRGLNSAARLEAAGVPASRIFTPPNVFDPEPFRRAPAVDKDVDVAYVGGLVGVKRVQVLLAALRMAREHRPALRAVIIGDGEEAAALRAQATAAGLDGRVTFLGRLPPDEIARWLARSRLFVMTSAVEGLPMAMIEAMSCGVPVILQDLGDVTTVARHGENAWIVDAGDPAAFASPIVELLRNDALRESLADGARRTAARFASDYSVEAAAAAWRGALPAG